MFANDHTVQREQAALLSDSDVSRNILLTHKNLRDPPLVLIISAKMFREQQNDRFCRNKAAKLLTGENLAFSNSKNGILSRVAYENKQIVVPKALQLRALNLCHYAKPSVHHGDIRLDYFLRRYFYWPSMFVDCYTKVQNFFTGAETVSTFAGTISP